ncbi:MAG: apolipoprotein N-acyltransferase [Clostridiales bacterium GWF2_36_10]|nr:MAG: apolipoprotein N-acyltransferase [Clostridiales bacterium GWF2_36_10]
MINFINKIMGLKLSPLIACFLAGVIYALPYYFDNLFFLSYISLTVLFIILLNGRRKKIFRYFYAFSYGFYFNLYLWISNLYPFESFDFSNSQAIIIILLACLGIPLYHALLHTLVMSLTKLLPENDYLITIGFGAAWILSEWIMSLGALGLPWGKAALSQIGVLFSVQAISLFGSYFIVIIVVCSSIMFALAIKNKKRLYALIGCIIISVNMITGVILYYIPTKTTDESVKVAILQGNIAMQDKWKSENTEEIFNTYISFAYEAAKNGAEIIVLPESAIPRVFNKNGIIYNSFSTITSEYNVTIIAGVLVDGGEIAGKYNSVVAVYPDGSVSNRYDKRHIVPFGEYIPYRDFLETMIPFVEGLNLGEFTTIAGEDTAIFDVEGMKNGSLVCFDSIFDSLARESVNDGAEILTVVTNDSWYEDSAGITQHLKHSVLRAIENKRYIIRAANTGISAYISPKGKVINKSEALTEAIIYSEVFPVKSKTLYTITGNLVLYAAMAFQIIIIGFNLYKKVKDKKHNAKNSKTI